MNVPARVQVVEFSPGAAVLFVANKEMHEGSSSAPVLPADATPNSRTQLTKIRFNMLSIHILILA